MVAKRSAPAACGARREPLDQVGREAPEGEEQDDQHRRGSEPAGAAGLVRHQAQARLPGREHQGDDDPGEAQRHDEERGRDHQLLHAARPGKRRRGADRGGGEQREPAQRAERSAAGRAAAPAAARRRAPDWAARSEA